MKTLLYSIITIACILGAISGIWYLQADATLEDQIEYIKANYLEGVGEGASNTAESASKLGKMLKKNFDEAKDVYEHGAEAKYE